MVTNKHINKIVVIIMAMAVVICVLAGIVVGRSDKYAENANILMEYPSKLFDTNEVISVNIKMDEDEWNEMLKNAMAEEYYSCDVEICGTTFKNVAIRPKGNTSLSSVARDPDTDRYSFKLEFGHFMEGQTCFGLDKLILNNNYADATNMKEAIVYDMFNFIGAASPLYNYASISLNGEYKGVYLALEAVEESFLLRNYGTQNGELYKPESMGGGGGDRYKQEQGAKSQQGPSGGKPDHGDFNPQDKPDMEGDTPGAPPQMPDMEGFDPANMPSPPEGKAVDRHTGNNGGANLNYIDDNLDSYSVIWDGEITETTDGDHLRVVTALKNISEGTDIEKYLDVDNILKYMAVHTFAVNMDSLSGNMAHNYYLYEHDGKLNLFPWDYNLSFGGMSSMGRGGEDSDKGTEMVNDAIDTPFSGTDFFDTLLENEEYLEKYHEYLRKLTEEYVDGGRFEETYNRIGSQIDALVKEDPTAFYSYDEYKTACETLYKAVKLRAESINGQLDGTIPSTDEEQKQDSAALIDGSEIDVSAMGAHSGGKKEGNPESQDNNFVKHSKKKSG
ncbi:MAG: CotH kinase family protein [Butyrivibrio hungatei]|nr:CotH kinase family protein [Butyrivibrio hungatei]